MLTAADILQIRVTSTGEMPVNVSAYVSDQCTTTGSCKSKSSVNASEMALKVCPCISRQYTNTKNRQS